MNTKLGFSYLIIRWTELIPNFLELMLNYGHEHKAMQTIAIIKSYRPYKSWENMSENQINGISVPEALLVAID